MGGKEYGRTARIAQQLRRELAEILARGTSDPRLERVAISAVDVSRDVSHAKVFVTLPEGVDAAPVVATLNRAAGFFKRQLGERLHLRALPHLKFVHDSHLEQAMQLSSLIDEAIADDNKKERS